MTMPTFASKNRFLWLIIILLSMSPRRFDLLASPLPSITLLIADAYIPKNPSKTLHRRSRLAASSPFQPDATTTTADDDSDNDKDDTVVDVAIIGAGLGGLCAGAILNTLYGKRVGIYEAHYVAGGCAHAFDRKSSSGQTFTFDSGPTILLGCSRPPWNALEQVLQAVNQRVEWIRYSGWGMIEHPLRPGKELRWKVTLGPNYFENGPLQQFGGPTALQEFKQLQQLTAPLLAGVGIPAMAMRSGPTALIPLLLRHFSALIEIIAQGNRVTGTFAPYMDGPLFKVTDPWLRHWLDALAFSLSGLPASRTAAAAMAFTLMDMHKHGAALDYPVGGMGSIVEALVRGVEQAPLDKAAPIGSKVHLRQTVQCINFSSDRARRAKGLTLQNGRIIKVRDGVICNAPVWSLRQLVQHDPQALMRLGGHGGNGVDGSGQVGEPHRNRPSTWGRDADGKYFIHLQRPAKADDNDGNEPRSRLEACDSAEQTGSFLHLHLAINASGIDLSKLEAHYTVMDRGLAGESGIKNDGPCGELNIIALSNPCVIDSSLAPPGTMVLHAYGAGNEPYEEWENLYKDRALYEARKKERSQVLWRAVESIIPDVQGRVLLDLTGSPLTHERFLRRPRGTYGAATEDYLNDGSTPIENLFFAGDSIFPGIGVPAVALSGASAANSLVSPWQHWNCLDKLAKQKSKQLQE
jgi:phytoene dehydrogenase-like protein